MPGPRPTDPPCKHAVPGAPTCPACARNRARVRAWALANPGRVVKRANRWQRKHKGRKQDIRRAYVVRKRPIIRARAAEACALARGAEWSAGPILLDDVHRADAGTCALCLGDVPAPGAVPPNDPSAPTADHVVPVTLGGPHSIDNIRLAHRSCNSKRGRAPFVVGMFATRVPASESPAPF